MSTLDRVPTITVGTLATLRDTHSVVEPATGEIVPTGDATNDALIAWRLDLDELAAAARQIRDAIDTELLRRTSLAGGPVTTTYGSARMSVSRGSVSGSAARRIRDILEHLATHGDIPHDAVDNIAPLVPHVTPVQVARWVADNRDRLSEADYSALVELLPAERRTVKVEP